MMRKYILHTLLLALFSTVTYAKIQLPDIISDNMVLQQNTQVKLWGKASPESVVSVKSSWDEKTYTTRSNSNGQWIISISTPKAGYTPQSISFSDGEAVTLNNILIGEVWFCSGQSNMEMPLNGFPSCPVLDANKSIANAAQFRSGIRFATIDKTPAVTPQETCKGKWQECIPENAPWFSATAFHFATALYKVINVPIGIINCSWGGSTIEGWLPESILKEYPDVDLKKAGSKDGAEYMQPMIMYNGMLKPLENYTIKGFLWYQGESNLGKHDTYADRLATMVKLWRKEWGLGELPFYYVEIAPYEYAKRDLGAYLREAQFRAQKLIPSSGMISTNDLVEPYEAHNIHPRNKTAVGQRLCYMALSRTYGIKGISDHGPIYKSMEIKNNKAILSFDNAKNGFSRMQDIKGFEIAGADKIFYPATAMLDWRQHIIVNSSKVSNPVAVRYGFRNFLPGNIYNNREQPLYPFRTDQW